MCWIGKYARRVARRDITVYKVGYILENKFISFFQSYAYEIKKINAEITLMPDIHSEYSLCVIYEGYHSYTDISMPYSKLGSSSRKVYLGKTSSTLWLCNNYYIATFIIPKGSDYFENYEGEIVSSNIIYTGKYVKIQYYVLD